MFFQFSARKSILIGRKRLAEIALQHVCVKHRHIAVQQYKRQVVTVVSAVVARKRAYSVGMGKGACFAMYAAPHARVVHQMVQGAVDS